MKLHSRPFHISRSLLCAVLLAAFAALGHAQPVVTPGSVRNAASALNNLPNSFVAQGSIFVVEGRNLGPDAPVKFSGYPLQTELGGTSVRVDAGGSTFDAPVMYTSAQKVAAILPSATPAGPANVTVLYNGQPGDPAPFQVAVSSFGAFTVSTSDDGKQILDSLLSGSPVQLNALGEAARPGQLISIWGTGLGATQGSDGDPAAGAAGTTASAQVLVDDRQIAVVNQGRADCCAGLDRIMVQVPDAFAGCYLPLSVKTGDVTNIVAAVSVAPEGQSCTPEGGFTRQDIEKARAQGSLKVGAIFLLEYMDPSMQQGYEMGWATFSRVSYDQIMSFQPALGQSIPGVCYAASVGRDGTVREDIPSGGMPGADFFNGFYPFGDQPLDAGSALNISGPAGNYSLQNFGPGIYYWIFANMQNPAQWYLSPGKYTLDNGSGGGDVGPFRASVDVAAPVTWTNANDLSVAPRSKDLAITWTGGGPQDRVWLYGYSYNLAAQGDDPMWGMIACSEQAKKGQLTVPASYLAKLPAGGNDSQSSIGYLMLYSGSMSSRFEASSGLDAGYLLRLGYAARLTSFQ